MTAAENGRAQPPGRPSAAAAEGGAPSLVDSAEQALHNWLAAGRYRQGDRLPPEHEVAVDARRLPRHAAQRAPAPRGGRRDRPPPGQRHVRRPHRDPDRARRAARAARALFVGRPPPRPAPLLRRPQDRAPRRRRRGRRGAGAVADRPHARVLAHPRRQRRPRRGDVRRRPPQHRAAAGAAPARVARAGQHGARHPDRDRHPGDLRAHARDPDADQPARARRPAAAASGARRRCSSSRS